MYKSNYLSQRLRNLSPTVFIIFGMLVSFITYTGTYAFRKPIGSATFSGMVFWGVDYKILVILSQLVGYAASKFIGAKIVSETAESRRPVLIFVIIGIAALSLLFFAITPPPYNVFWMLVNGLPLGMVWGIIFSYLEGRACTEILGAGLACTQVFSSGFVKTLGKLLMINYGVSQMWMPFVTGCLFLLPLCGSIWLLSHLPPPTDKDVALRSKRTTMTASDRCLLLKKYTFGIAMMIIIFLLLTILRDFRDNFSAEIWRALGQGNDAYIFTKTEIPIFILILMIVGSMIKVKDNVLAFMLNHMLIFAGFLIVGVATLLYTWGIISAFMWMTLIGMGLYTGYVPFQIMMLDRFIAVFRCVGTASFLVLLADGFGYLASINTLLYKNFGFVDLNYRIAAIRLSFFVSVCGCVAVMLCWVYFYKKIRTTQKV